MANSQALASLSSQISARTAFNPYGVGGGRVASANNLNNFITPVQFARLAHDIKMWREAIREMELAFFPMRVRTMRMYIDVVENPYVKAVINRWKELTLQRDYTIYQVKGGKKIQSDILTETIREQSWFSDYLEYVTEAEPWGYSLISLGNMIDDSFPEISSIRRENIRPDGTRETTSPILTSMVYAIDGVHITDDKLVNMCNHWIPTKSNRGVSRCGYGWLYNIGLLEIHLRHIMEWNIDFLEVFGMPIKVGKTEKQGDERKDFEDWLSNVGSNAYALLDNGDSLEYVFAQQAGTAWKSYENVEARLEGKISQLVLGHTDAIKSTPGKLGGMQAANKDGFNESFVEQAMNAKQISAGNFACRKINEVCAPRLRDLGKYTGSRIIRDLIPEGYTFGLLNDKEENQIRRTRNADMIATGSWVKSLNEAGWNVEQKQLEDWTNLTLSPAPPEHKLIEERTNTLIDKSKST